MTWKITGAPGTGDDLLYSQAGTPTLDLRFASSKSLNDNVSGQNLIDFTRGGNGVGTYVGSDGLIKNSVVNLLLRSEEFDNTTSWPDLAAAVTRSANFAPSPTGANSADRIEFPAADTGINQVVIGAVIGASYTISIYARGTAGQTLRLTGVNLGVGANVTLGENWQRFTLTGTATNTALSFSISTFGGATARDIVIWGAQLEQSSTVGEYVKTTSSISGAPRFDHDPETGESLGLLIEESRTNLLLRSEEFGNVYWNLRTNINAPTANAVTSPTGELNADKITETATTGVHYIARNSVSISAAGSSSTLSVYAKAAERSFIGLQITDGTNYIYCTFDLSAGTASTPVNTGTGSGATASIVNAGNGWYRCILSGIYASSGTTPVPVFYIGTSNVNLVSNVYSGVDGNGIYLWGAQFEASASFPTSYIPTTSTTVTRNADVAQITGSNFSRWYSQSQGTVFSAFSIPTGITTGGSRVYSISNSSYTTQVWLRLQGGVNRLYEVIDSSAQQALLSAGTFSAGVVYKGAVAVKTNDFGFSDNGSTPTVDNSGTMGNVDRMGVGMDPNGIAPLNGHIRRLSFFDRRLPNAVLQAITAP